MEFQFTRKNLDQLLQLDGQTVISIYLPTHKSGTDQQQNPIRFANLVKEARELLEKSGLSTHQLKLQLDDVADMGMADAPLWEFLKSGLAIFVTESDIQVVKLPIQVKEYAVINHHPFIKPLLPLITTNGKFYILTLSQNDIKLYQANRTDIDKVFLGDLERNMEEKYDFDDLRSHLQHHSSSSGGGKAVFHGQGAGEESMKADISQFLNEVENGITDLLEGEEAPLVLAGVEYLISMYRGHNKYKHLTETTVEGNPENTTKEKLHQAAWEIVRPIFKAKEQAALDKYHQMAGTGKTGTDLEEVVKAAFDGKIETLFVLRGQEVWGEYVDGAREVLIHDKRTAHSTDLIDLATARTLVNGGTVYSLKDEEMIKDQHIAALYRY